MWRPIFSKNNEKKKKKKKKDIANFLHGLQSAKV